MQEPGSRSGATSPKSGGSQNVVPDQQHQYRLGISRYIHPRIPAGSETMRAQQSAPNKPTR